MCGATEFSELPVRHNEDLVNLTLSSAVRYPIEARSAGDPHTKAGLLLQVRGSLSRQLYIAQILEHFALSCSDGRCAAAGIAGAFHMDVCTEGANIHPQSTVSRLISAPKVLSSKAQ